MVALQDSSGRIQKMISVVQAGRWQFIENWMNEEMYNLNLKTEYLAELMIPNTEKNPQMIHK